MARSNENTARLWPIGPGTRTVPGIGEIVEIQQGLDWLHPGVAVKDTGRIGLGLVALEPIAKDETVLLFGGKMMTWEEITKLPHDMWDIPYQVADDLFFGIAKREEIGAGEKINHSCNPNTGFVSEMRLCAINDIMPGDDVTMDYATCSSMDGYRLECACGSRNCRKVITGDDWMSTELQRRLGKYFQPYLREKLPKPMSQRASFEGAFWDLARKAYNFGKVRA